MLDGLLDRKLPAQAHILDGHDAAGAVLGVFEDFVDHLAGVGVGTAQNPLDHVGRHFLNDVHGVVEVELVDNLLELVVGKAPDEQLLLVGLHFDKGLRRQLLGQQPKEQGQAVCGQLLKQGRNIGRVERDQHVPQGGILFLLQQGDQRLPKQHCRFFHVLIPPFFPLRLPRARHGACGSGETGRNKACSRGINPRLATGRAHAIAAAAPIRRGLVP